MGCWILTGDPVAHRLANDFCSYRIGGYGVGWIQGGAERGGKVWGWRRG